MKKAIVLLFFLGSSVFISCKKDANDPGVRTTDESVFFSIFYNGKTTTQYGTKNTNTLDNNFLKRSVSAVVKTDVNLNQSSITIVATGEGGYMGGLNNSTMTVNIHAIKPGGSLGVYNTLVGENSIVFSDDPMVVHSIGNCTITITSIDTQYVIGTIEFDLDMHAIGSFKLNRF